jgi:hypothetical protein
MTRKQYFTKTRNIRRKNKLSRRASKRKHRFFTRRVKKQRGGMSYTGLSQPLGLTLGNSDLVPRSREGVSGLEEKGNEPELF